MTTRAFLGLTMSCARCHDHKSDPIQQRDYYALAGIFQSTETLSGGRRDAYVDPDLALRLPAAGVVHNATAEMDDKGFHRIDPNRAMGATEGALEDCAIRIKGEPNQRGDTPRRGEIAMPGLAKLPAISAKESGRLQLAQWIVSPANPLTARVMVNRVWARLFGRGIVASVDNFGVTGEKPTHPELLDHLAVRFVEGGYSVKKLLRAVMLSHTYRQSSASDPGRLKRDGANELFWRMNPKRLELEAIRDAMLFAAGSLDFARPAGLQIAGNGGKGKVGRTRALLDETAAYRTVYLPVLRDLLPEIYKTFDFPEPTQILGKREVTTVPAQALFFLNSRLATDAARETAARLGEVGGDEARVRRAYLLLLGREPARDEMAEARAFLAENSSDWTSLVQSLMAGAEFRYVW